MHIISENTNEPDVFIESDKNWHNPFMHSKKYIIHV